MGIKTNLISSWKKLDNVWILCYNVDDRLEKIDCNYRIWELSQILTNLSPVIGE